jgi:hypothetical protein
MQLTLKDGASVTELKSAASEPVAALSPCLQLMHQLLRLLEEHIELARTSGLAAASQVSA